MFRLCLNNVIKRYIYSLNGQNLGSGIKDFQNALKPPNGSKIRFQRVLKALNQFKMPFQKVLIPQNQLKTCFQERFDETASRCDIVLKEARAELDQTYFAIRERINALAIVEGLADYENFIRTLNAVVAKYTAILNSRLGKRGKKGGGAENV